MLIRIHENFAVIHQHKPASSSSHSHEPVPAPSTFNNHRFEFTNHQVSTMIHHCVTILSHRFSRYTWTDRNNWQCFANRNHHQWLTIVVHHEPLLWTTANNYPVLTSLTIVVNNWATTNQPASPSPSMNHRLIIDSPSIHRCLTILSHNHSNCPEPTWFVINLTITNSTMVDQRRPRRQANDPKPRITINQPITSHSITMNPPLFIPSSIILTTKYPSLRHSLD